MCQGRGVGRAKGGLGFYCNIVLFFMLKRIDITYKFCWWQESECKHQLSCPHKRPSNVPNWNACGHIRHSHTQNGHKRFISQWACIIHHAASVKNDKDVQVSLSAERCLLSIHLCLKTLMCHWVTITLAHYTSVSNAFRGLHIFLFQL